MAGFGLIGERDGAPRTCGSCRYWSEMLAKAVGGGPVQAMCLAREGELRGKYTTERGTCKAWASGHLGAVDTPDSEPPDYENEPGEQAPGTAGKARTGVVTCRGCGEELWGPAEAEGVCAECQRQEEGERYDDPDPDEWDYCDVDPAEMQAGPEPDVEGE